MKKLIISLFAIVAMAVTSEAQVINMGTQSADTITDAGSKTYNRRLKAGFFRDVSIQIIVNKLSGTAAGTAVVYGAISDNSGTGGDTTAYVPTGDTLVITDQAVNTAIFDYPEGQYTHYRVVITGSGTMSTRNRVFMYTRKD